MSPVAADDRVRVEAESLRHEQGVVRAEGEAKAHYQGYELCAARLIYDRQERRIRAEEEVRLTREGYRLSGDRLEFDLDDGTGAAGASEALTPEDLRLLGATLRIEGKDLFAEEVYATRCPAEDEDWRLNASSAHLDSEAKTLFLRDLYLDVGGGAGVVFAEGVVLLWGGAAERVFVSDFWLGVGWGECKVAVLFALFRSRGFDDDSVLEGEVWVGAGE